MFTGWGVQRAGMSKDFRHVVDMFLELLGRKGQYEKGWRPRAEGVWVRLRLRLRTRRACFRGDADRVVGMMIGLSIAGATQPQRTKLQTVIPQVYVPP